MQQARSNGWLGLSLFVCITLCCGCQSKPSYGWVYYKRANFAGLKTYQWLSVEEKGTAFRQIGGKPIDQLVNRCEARARGQGLYTSRRRSTGGFHRAMYDHPGISPRR